MKREVLICAPWDPVTGRVGMVHSCTRGSLDWMLGSVSLLRGCLYTATGFLERGGRCLRPVVCKKRLDNVLNNLL